ncbi:hypothetical protein V8E36_009770 [Tilletia maclaganii]
MRSELMVQLVSVRLSKNSVWIYQGQTPRTESFWPLPDNYALLVHQLYNICRNGQEPTRLFVRSTLLPGFSYRSDYISPAITPSTQALPAFPSNVRVARVSGSTRDFRATWSSVGAATGGYLPVFRSDLNTYGYGYQEFSYTNFTEAGVTTATVRIGRRDVFKDVAVLSETGTDVVSDIRNIRRYGLS